MIDPTPRRRNDAPPAVAEGRERKLRGERLAPETLQARQFYCRSCGGEQRSALVPRGWYTLTRATGTVIEKPHRLGLYCSLRCLESQMERLIGIEGDLGEGFTEVPSEFRQTPT